jgi:hypothetical protein
VPVVGRLQARRERRRGLQVPSGVIEVSANIVEELRSMRVLFSPSDLPYDEGFTFLL